MLYEYLYLGSGQHGLTGFVHSYGRGFRQEGRRHWIDLHHVLGGKTLLEYCYCFAFVLKCRAPDLPGCSSPLGSRRSLLFLTQISVSCIVGVSSRVPLKIEKSTGR